MKTNITIELPEDVARVLREKWGDLARHTIETLAIEGYRTQTLSAARVRKMLGFQTRMEVDAFLKRSCSLWGIVYVEVRTILWMLNGGWMHHLRIATITLIFLCCSSLALTQVQTPAATAPSGSLTGTVLNSATGQPVEGVQVSIVSGQPIPETGIQTIEKPSAEIPQIMKVLPAFVLGGQTLMAERKMYSVLTDSGGRFLINGVAEDSYSLSLGADGFIFQTYGEKPNSLTWLPIVVKDSKTDVGVIRMDPGARVTGTIVNDEGGSISGITVFLLNARMVIDVDSQRKSRVVRELSTDSSGRYSFDKVAAGNYSIAVGSFPKSESLRVSAADPTGTRVPAVLPYPFTFYPGASDAGLASQFDVPVGGRVVLGDLIVRKVEPRSIRGHVVDTATGKPPASVRVSLSAAFPFLSAGRASREILNVRYTQATGVFEATNLIPGTYRIDADLPRPPAPRTEVAIARVGDISSQSAFQILELRNEDLQDLVLRVPSNGKVVGKIVVAEGKPLPIQDTGLPIPFQFMLRPLGPLQPVPVVTSVSVDDGSFQVGTTLDGRYRFSINPLKDNYYVSETKLNGVRIANGILDISKDLSTELSITLSQGGEVRGSVVDTKGQPVSQAQGLLLPDPLPEIIPFYSQLLADASGRFLAGSIPPGNYKIYVWDGVESDQFFDRDRLQRTHAQATAVHVDKGGHTTTSVPIITIP